MTVRVDDFEMVEVGDETMCVQMVEINDIEVNTIQLPTRYIDMLRNTGAQGHMPPPSPHHNYGYGQGIVKMENGATAKIY